MATSTLRQNPHDARTPADFDDVCCALTDGHACAADAMKALQRAQDALDTADPVEAAAQLATAVEQLQEALKAASECAAPMLAWSDRASGDW